MGLRHRSIRLRVGILIVVPVLCLIALYGFAASITLGSALTQAHAKTVRNDLLTPVDNFQAALAAERHLAVLSLADPTSTQFASEVGMQENNTRKALDALRRRSSRRRSPTMLGRGADGRSRTCSAEAGTLTAIRSNVAAGAISMSAALADYNRIIDAGYTVLDEAIDAQSNVPRSDAGTGRHQPGPGPAGGARGERPAHRGYDTAQVPGGRPDHVRRAGGAAAATGRPPGLAELLPDYAAVVNRNVTPAIEQAADGAGSQGHIDAVA